MGRPWTSRLGWMAPTGARRWIQRLVVHGRRRELGLGGFPLVSLKEANEKAFTNRKLAREGGDPLADRTVTRTCFAEAAERVWTDMAPPRARPRRWRA